MRQVLLGCLLGVGVLIPSAWALRTSSPPTFHEWNTNTFTQLNNALLQIFNVINGRYVTDVVTSDPDGTRRGTQGELLLYDNAGTGSLCVNMGTTDWDCVGLTD